MYHPLRRPLSGYGDITITRRRFSQIVKALAGSRPKAPLSDYRGFGWLSEDNCSHPKAFLSDYRNIGWSPEGDKVSLYIFKSQKMNVKLFNIDPRRNIMRALNRFSWRKNTGTFHQYFSSRSSDITVKISHHVKIIRNRLTDVPFIIDAPFICCSFTFKLSLISGINISRQVV